MARPDGRIEKGQRLATAISARAWNRAQEAADRVLGAGTGAEAGPLSLLEYSIVVPVQLTAAPGINYSYVGVPIKISGCEVFGTTAAPAGLKLLRGEIAEPTDLRNTTLLPAPEMFALTVEPMKSGETLVVQCAIKGLAVARVRQFADTDRYVALPTRRATAETVDSLRGTLETSAAGYGRLVAVINSDFCLVSI
jgi:hypothetical protein